MSIAGASMAFFITMLTPALTVSSSIGLKFQAPAANNTQPSTQNKTAPVTPMGVPTSNQTTSVTKKNVPTLNETAPVTRQEGLACTTRKDPRAQAWWATTSPEGTPCVFGVDARDEGSHCIPETQYGSNGWCFTSADLATWGSCADGCPLYGLHKILGDKIDSVGGRIGDLATKMAGKLRTKGEQASMLAMRGRSFQEVKRHVETLMAAPKRAGPQGQASQPTAPTATSATSSSPSSAAASAVGGNVTAAQAAVVTQTAMTATSAPNTPAPATPSASPAAQPVEQKPAASATCVTRKDPRAHAWWATTSPEGTPCVFGADARDEGSHCIDDVTFGSNGWCFTDHSQKTWGSCSADCPLYGPNKVLSEKIDSVKDQIDDLAHEVAGNATGENATALALLHSSTVFKSILSAKETAAQSAPSLIVSAGGGTTASQAPKAVPTPAAPPATGSAAGGTNSSSATASTSVPTITTGTAASFARNATTVPEALAAEVQKESSCMTRKDPRARAWWAVMAPEKTPCVFGADARDEGRHCIPETEYGSNGWCFTKSDLSAWGSCGDECPLFGPHKILGEKIDEVGGRIGDLVAKVEGNSADQVEPATQSEVSISSATKLPVAPTEPAAPVGASTAPVSQAAKEATQPAAAAKQAAGQATAAIEQKVQIVQGIMLMQVDAKKTASGHRDAVEL